MSYCFHIFSQHYSSSLYHKEICVSDARGHIDEVEAGRREGEEEDEGEQGAIGDPHHPLEHRHLPLPGRQLGLRSQAGLEGKGDLEEGTSDGVIPSRNTRSGNKVFLPSRMNGTFHPALLIETCCQVVQWIGVCPL